MSASLNTDIMVAGSDYREGVNNEGVTLTERVSRRQEEIGVIEFLRQAATKIACPEYVTWTM